MICIKYSTNGQPIKRMIIPTQARQPSAQEIGARPVWWVERL